MHTLWNLKPQCVSLWFIGASTDKNNVSKMNQTPQKKNTLFSKRLIYLATYFSLTPLTVRFLKLNFI